MEHRSAHRLGFSEDSSSTSPGWLTCRPFLPLLSCSFGPLGGSAATGSFSFWSSFSPSTSFASVTFPASFSPYLSGQCQSGLSVGSPGRASRRCALSTTLGVSTFESRHGRKYDQLRRVELEFRSVPVADAELDRRPVAERL